jgi:polysaccharide pyruvyl transferase WcaK-like protein
MSNIIFSTTRQWNPGDEFILAGIRNLLREAGISHNPAIYNRNPEILQPYSELNFAKSIRRTFPGKNFLSSFVRLDMWDNSFKFGMSGKSFDACVIAGSPGWYGRESLPLYECVRENKIPVFFIGIGSHDQTSEALTRNVEKTHIADILSTAKLITTRDSVTLGALARYGAIRLPCPALLSVRTEKTIERVQKIALMYSTDRTVPNHKVPSKMFEKMVNAYRTIVERFGGKYEIEFVAHYIDEMVDYNERKLFELPLRYSFDSAEYAGIYGEFDLVIGPRVHGVGIAASMGVPGLHLGHDHRSETVEGFAAQTYSLDTLDTESFVRCVEGAIDGARLKSEELKRWKAKVKEEYMEKIKLAWGV